MGEHQTRSVLTTRATSGDTDPLAPSTTFLFDLYRTGRLRYGLASYTNLCVNWEYSLPSYPPRGPESTPAIDAAGNLYFGCHDGCIYSLTPQGVLRWMYHTDRKVYASPTLYRNERLVITSGDGHCYCFTLAGQLLWRYHIASLSHISSRWKRKLLTIWNRQYAYDRVLRQLWQNKCWSSPAVDEEGTVYVTGLGLGLHALSIDDGRPRWTYDLGHPWYHLAGVALDDSRNVYVASQRYALHSVTADGARRWLFSPGRHFDAWGNPSIDIAAQTVYFPISCQEHAAEIIALNLEGQVRWRTLLPTAVRGSVAIGYADYVLVCGFNGRLYFLEKATGAVQQAILISKAERALWTTSAIDPQGNILLTTKDSDISGRLVVLDQTGMQLAEITTGKALSTPVIDSAGCIYVGSWRGSMFCLAAQA